MIIKNIIDDLFTFPIVMVDGENEEQKKEEKERKKGLGIHDDDEEEYDIIYGEACYPYYDFRGFEDRWLPTQRSLEKAIEGKFDSCLVRFDNSGSYLVPLSKEKFLRQISSFIKKREDDKVEELKTGHLLPFNIGGEITSITRTTTSDNEREE